MMRGSAKDISAWDCNEDPKCPLELVGSGNVFQIDSVRVSVLHDMKTGKHIVHAAEAVNCQRVWRSDHFRVLVKPIELQKYKLQ